MEFYWLWHFVSAYYTSKILKSTECLYNLNVLNGLKKKKKADPELLWYHLSYNCSYREIQTISKLEHRNYEVRSSIQVTPESSLQQQPVPVALRRGAVPGMYSTVLLQNIIQAFSSFWLMNVVSQRQCLVIRLSSHKFAQLLFEPA